MQLKPLQLITAVYGYVMFVFLLFLSFFCTALAAPCGHQTANRWKERVMGRWLVYAMQCACIWSLEIRGLDRLDGRQAMVVVPNHQSIVDNAVLSFITASPSREKKYLTKMQYFSLPIFGWMQWLAGDIPVDTRDEKSRKRSLDACARAVNNGSSIVIYAEGTRNPRPSDGLLPFKTGAFRTAKACGVPVLPVALHNTGHAMVRLMRIRAGVRMTCVIGEPIVIKDDDDLAAISARTRAWIETTLAELDRERVDDDERAKLCVPGDYGSAGKA